jgi:hypothetical protein
MDEMILLPGEGVAEESTKGDSMPWLERREGRGRLKAWFAMFSRVFSNPASLIALVPGDRPSSESLLFGLSVLVPCFLVNGSVFAVSGLTSVLVGSSLSGVTGDLLSIVVNVLMLALLVLLGVLVQACAAHLTILLTGGTTQPFRRTVECLCYASPTAFFAAFPCLGFLLAPIMLTWWYVSSAQMLGQVHKASMKRAATGVLIIPVGLVLLFAGSMLVNAWSLKRTPGTFRWSSSVTTSPEQKFAAALMNYRSLHGQFPTHPLDLAADLKMTLPLLSPYTSLDAAKVGDTTLATMGDLMTTEQIAALVRTLPPSPTPAAGDVTLLCPGLATATSPSTLWVACVRGPASTAPVPGFTFTSATLVLADGSLAPAPNLEGADFTEQQLLRQSLGLAPLPPLSSWR